MCGGYPPGGASGVTLPEATACPEPSYAVHFHGFGPRPNGNAKNLAPLAVTGRTCMVFPPGLVTTTRVTEWPALPYATAGTPAVQKNTLVPSPVTDVVSMQLLASVPPACPARQIPHGPRYAVADQAPPR
jgi:hypothetical protein